MYSTILYIWAFMLVPKPQLAPFSIVIHMHVVHVGYNIYNDYMDLVRCDEYCLRKLFLVVDRPPQKSHTSLHTSQYIWYTYEECLFLIKQRCFGGDTSVVRRLPQLPLLTTQLRYSKPGSPSTANSGILFFLKSMQRTSLCPCHPASLKGSLLEV